MIERRSGGEAGLAAVQCLEAAPQQHRVKQAKCPHRRVDGVLGRALAHSDCHEAEDDLSLIHI